jgi:hypothetical protein
VRHAIFHLGPLRIGNQPAVHLGCLVITFVFAPLQLTRCHFHTCPHTFCPLSGGDPWEASGRRRDVLELARRRNALEPAARCPQASGRRQDALETRVHLFVRVGGAQIRVLPGRPVLILPWSAGSVWRKQDSGDGGPIRSSIGMTYMQPRRQKTRTEPGWAR